MNERESLMSMIKTNLRSYTMIIALVLIWIIFAFFTNGSFLKPQNISNLFRQMTIISFLGIGMVFVIVTGNIDLSVGSVCGLISAIAAFFQAYVFPNILPHIFPEVQGPVLGIISTVLTIIISLMASIIIGMFQGYITAYLAVPAFIVTLGGQLIFRGGVLGITQGKTIVPIENSLVLIAQGYIPKLWGWILAILIVIILFLMVFWKRKQQSKYGFEMKPLFWDLLKAGFFSFFIFLYVFIVNRYRGVQNPVILMGVIALVFAYLSTNTKFGRYCYAIGGNPEATRLSGVNIKMNVFKVMILMGLLSGIAGIVLTGYVAAGTIGGGLNYELSAIAACVIGGTSLMGGTGTIFGALVGALVMASIENGMSVMNMDVFWQYIVKGMVLIIAVYIDIATKKK